MLCMPLLNCVPCVGAQLTRNEVMCRMERQRLLTRTPLHGERCSFTASEGGAGDAMAGGSELFEVTKTHPCTSLLALVWLRTAVLLVLTAAMRQSLCIATQERKLLAREKGMLESILKSTMEEISRMLEVETLNNEQVVRTRRSGAEMLA